MCSEENICQKCLSTCMNIKNYTHHHRQSFSLPYFCTSSSCMSSNEQRTRLCGCVHSFKMVDKSAILVARKKKGSKKRKTVMSSRLEKLEKPPAQWQPDLTSAGCFVCLLGAVAYAVMSTKKKVSAVVKKTVSRRVKKVRSISMSLDLECPGRIQHGNHSSATSPDGALMPHKKCPRGMPGRHLVDRMRTVSACEYVDQFLTYSKADFVQRVNASNAALAAHREPSDNFPFELLPPDCQLKVFSFLKAQDRGVASQVCSEWRALINTSSLWNSVDLTAFPLCHKSGSHECSELCYAHYRNRIKKFFQYMQYVRPVLKRLQFSYDIGDFKDGWLENLTELLKASRCQDLEVAHLNWKETPIKPFWRDSITWSTNDYNELMHRHRHRQRLFVNFFDVFTAAAPNVCQLKLPFDWSARSVRALGRLQRLEKLSLEKYFMFQTLDQEMLDSVLGSLPALRRLALEVWTPSARGLQLYSISAPHLEHLDVSQCRGFYLDHVHLPAVRTFRVSRSPWTGPLTTVDGAAVPCLHQVLAEGATALITLNDHTLHKDWRDVVYPELEQILVSVCSCPKHKSGVFM